MAITQAYILCGGLGTRLGGLVKPGSVRWAPEQSSLSFEVTDGKNTVAVQATGAPPQMFREGIGVVVEGRLQADGQFRSDRLMVKHSNEYRAPTDGGMPDDGWKKSVAGDAPEKHTRETHQRNAPDTARKARRSAPQLFVAEIAIVTSQGTADIAFGFQEPVELTVSFPPCMVPLIAKLRGPSNEWNVCASC